MTGRKYQVSALRYAPFKSMFTFLERLTGWLNSYANKHRRRSRRNATHSTNSFYDGNGERWPALGESKR